MFSLKELIQPSVMLENISIHFNSEIVKEQLGSTEQSDKKITLEEPIMRRTNRNRNEFLGI
jgi:hypothetical protein